jgi:hypothetical protein
LSYVVLCPCLKSESGCKKIATKFVHSLFKIITKEEWEVLQREVEEFYNESNNQNYSILPKSVEKGLVGCLRKFVATLQFER